MVPKAGIYLPKPRIRLYSATSCLLEESLTIETAGFGRHGREQKVVGLLTVGKAEKDS
jgi:hypothetical protein